MMTLKEIEQALYDRKLAVVAEETGLHYNTVRSYAKGLVKKPSHDAYSKLSEYLSK